MHNVLNLAPSICHACRYHPHCNQLMFHAGTTEQFHENGYFADPQTINELAQYWEDQRNIDSLLGSVQQQQGTGKVSVQRGGVASSMHEEVNGRAQQQPTQSDSPDNQQVGVQQQEDTDAGRVMQNHVAADETHVNPLSNLVNYSSSDDDT